MTSPTNQPTLAEQIDLYLIDGMPVFDMNGDSLGDVKMYSTAAGYLMVEYGAFDRKNLYIPFRLIRSIDPNEIYLTQPKATLTEQFTEPPKIRTHTEERLVTGPGGVMTSEKRDVQMVESGYDDQPVALNSVDVSEVAGQLAIGMVVYDNNGNRLGDLTQYDIPRRLMAVEKGLVNPRVLFVPFSAIANIDQGDLTIYLALPREVIVKEHGMLPADA